MQKPVRATIRVVRRDCEVTKKLYELGLRPKAMRVKPGPEKSVHIVTLEEEPSEEHLRELGARKIGERTIVVASRSCTACRLLSQLDVYVVGDRPLDAERIDYDVIAPDRGRLKSAVLMLASAGLQPKLLASEELKAVGLTPRQLEFLLMAYREGFFCVDRKTTLTEIANKLGVKPGSLEDVVRRALKKVVEYYLINEGVIPSGSSDVLDGCA
ncbi:MAG: helix-turn-helix domain-containing protein [Thermoproteus sp. AZ2]|uniref:Helix-turn-helix domain-containing protein n=1 Tax=Thermoproteus sp. AZ2 TaxID=1609232 RepID=A0ACC6V2M6_9CREN|nr:MAG: hypothetical protein TU35_03920 [Thermoproteus sp. AZ2]